MQNEKQKILVWLPSPMGDAIACTPALRALRRRFQAADITFFANSAVRQVLSPSSFNDVWIQQDNRNPFAAALKLLGHDFSCAIMFKNSFSSAMAVFLARIPERIGYARQGRTFMLTGKLYPEKLPDGSFKPIPAIDYYLNLAGRLGCEISDRNPELSAEPPNSNLPENLKRLVDSKKPVIILVPGGAFGPSKRWLPQRFAETADRLISDYNATVILSVAPTPTERKIAGEICSMAEHKLVNLADQPVNLAVLKTIFAAADLVITNDTGPRHIAIGLKRKVVTLFGPNDPAWTDSGYTDEIQIVGDAPCVPCARHKCRQPQHLCMQSITVDMVCEASENFLDKTDR